jgi:hypothetical protein
MFKKPEGSGTIPVFALIQSRWRKPTFWLIVLAILALLTFAVQHWMFTPLINPNPQQKVVVRGTFPYDQGWDLKITTSFYSSNPECKVAARAFFLFKAADVSRKVFVDIPVTREGGNRYSFTYYEDYFTPGYCKWKQGFIGSEQLVKGRWWSGRSINGLNQGKYNVINYECSWMSMLLPGISETAREMMFNCFDHLGKNNRRDPLVKDNQLNFNFNPKILYQYYDTHGRIESKWVEKE